MFRKMFVLTALLFLSSICLFSEDLYSIDFYGIISENLDRNMADMTSDLYYTQLCEIKNFSVTDKRDQVHSENIDTNYFSEEKLSFYTVIKQKENSGKWIATLHIYNKMNNTEFSASKEYDSYYKILMESKSDLQKSFISLIQDHSQGQSPAAPSEPKNRTIAASTENLAGTWSGEQNIDKILIMRGGRGFVIFKNGASMNITVKVEDSLVTISQTGKSNASFFPELPRQTALEAALAASPITWNLELTEENTLKGTKNTLIAEGTASPVPGIIPVEWSRRQ